MISRGLPAKSVDKTWSKWLSLFPTPSPLQDRGELMIYERALFDHLDRVPATNRLTMAERREVASVLILFCQDFQNAQAMEVEIDLISFGVAITTFVGAIFLPMISVPLATLGVMVAGGRTAVKYEARRRNRILKNIIDAVQRLLWSMH